MTSTLFPTRATTTTLLILFLSALSIANALVDTDGEPLMNGGKYYIIPKSTGNGGGLALKSKSETSPCPLYIARDDDENSQGIPVRITSPFRILQIPPSLPVTIAFQHTPNICMEQSLGWQVILDETNGQSYVTTGGSREFNPIFFIDEVENNMYKVRHAEEESGDVGIFEKDGLLGITYDNPLHVLFKKAPSGVLAETKTKLQIY